MYIEAVKNSLQYLGKHLLATVSPSATLAVDFCPTHLFCNQQARLILHNDGFTAEANILNQYQHQLDIGICWPDSGIGSLHHFYNPQTGNGLPGGKPATFWLEQYFYQSQELWYRGKFEKAMFYLGAATHFLQDACEPHHSNCVIGFGHVSFEKWAKERLTECLVSSDGIYHHDWLPSRWLNTCACQSHAYLPDENGIPCLPWYQEASQVLLTMTQQITAGFWLYYLTTINISSSLLASNPVSKAS